MSKPEQNIVGQKYGTLTVTKDLGMVYPPYTRGVMAICECGKEKQFRLGNLKTGSNVCCGQGCPKRPLTDIGEFIGKRFGRLVITGDLGRGFKDYRMVDTICDCGNTKKIKLIDLKSGKVRSCDCLKSELSAKRATKHGLYGHPIYKVYYGIKQRCSGKTKGYEDVTICEEWKDDFLKFYNWCLSNGYKKGLQIDKDKLAPTKTGKIYSPEYCCFLTRQENLWYKRNSRMLTYNNETKSLGEWCELLGLDVKRMCERYKKGWSTQRMFETPCLEKYRNKKIKNITL